MAYKKRYEDTPETLLNAILVMQDKLVDLEDDFKTADLTIEAEMGDGRTITRANPLIQEYRALLKDFTSVLKTYKEISGDGEAKTDTLESIRNKFKVAL